MLLAMFPKLAISLLVGVATCAVAQDSHLSGKKPREIASENEIRSSKQLSPADRTLLIRAIAADLRPEMNDFGIDSEKQLLSQAAHTRIELVDLDGDGTPEVFVQSSGPETCGAVGNCLFWIFKKTNGIYKPILSGGAQTFSIEDTSTNGFRDVTLGLQDSATEDHLYPYRFSNGMYRKYGCYVEKWTKELGGPMLKRPIVTKCK
jgi:hypothetical protein